MFKSQRNKMILFGIISVLVVLNLSKYMSSGDDLDLDPSVESNKEASPVQTVNADVKTMRSSLAWVKSAESSGIERDLFAIENLSSQPEISVVARPVPKPPATINSSKLEKPGVEVFAVTSSSGNATALVKVNGEMLSVAVGSVIEGGYKVDSIENGKVYLKSMK